jgi:hypothetical protein
MAKRRRGGNRYRSRITAWNLQSAYEKLPAEERGDWGRVTFAMAMLIVKHFLGGRWIGAHIIPRRGKSGFFRLDFSSDQERERKTFRICDLAECLFNLQDIGRFHECVARMRSGDNDQVEATMAELDFGKLLHVHDVNFHFVAPGGGKGADYDFELVLADGLVVCADGSRGAAARGQV